MSDIDWTKPVTQVGYVNGYNLVFDHSMLVEVRLVGGDKLSDGSVLLRSQDSLAVDGGEAPGIDLHQYSSRVALPSRRP